MKLLLLACLIIGAFAGNFKEFPAITDDMVNFINEGNYGWKARVNEKFSQASLQDVMDMCGALPSPPSDEPRVEVIAPSIPDSFDSREAWPDCKSIKIIRDQSVCGSCWAFGASEAWSDRVCIATNGQVNELLSAQDILTCCGFTCGSGCNGGYLSGAWSYIKNHGLVSGGLYGDNSLCQSYTLAPCSHHVNSSIYPPCGKTVPTPKCHKECNNGANWDSDKHKASRTYAVSSKVEAIQTEIMTHGPIEAAFSVYNDFITYSGGVYRHVTGSFLGGHAIKIIGWGVENGTPYWLVANSWNESWGDKGLFKILRGSNECNIESDGYAGVL